jgi:hypothetical protein
MRRILWWEQLALVALLALPGCAPDSRSECADNRLQHEVCGNAVDEDCDGLVDENPDLDGDGFGTCDGDCCESSECGDPPLVNPGAYDQVGNNVDDDCDGFADNEAVHCDPDLASGTSDPMDFARAIDLCATTVEDSRRWGVLSAELTLTDGLGVPSSLNHSIRDGYGTSMTARAGSKLAVFSTGVAADPDDLDPDFQPIASVVLETYSAPPADWFTANGGSFPNLPGCPEAVDYFPRDPVMLTLKVRVPINARSFSLDLNFLSHEYPEYICSQFNDFFVVLLDSAWAGDPANPSDKNLATYTSPSGIQYPIGSNLAFDNTGLFRSCQNGQAGCMGEVTFDHVSCTSVSELEGTTFHWIDSSQCQPNTRSGGGTGWLTTQGNVVGGEVITLRIALWDTTDGGYDSTALVDNFRWSVDASEPGTGLIE